MSTNRTGHPLSRESRRCRALPWLRRFYCQRVWEFRHHFPLWACPQSKCRRNNSKDRENPNRATRRNPTPNYLSIQNFGGLAILQKIGLSRRQTTGEGSHRFRLQTRGFRIGNTDCVLEFHLPNATNAPRIFAKSAVLAILIAAPLVHRLGEKIGEPVRSI